MTSLLLFHILPALTMYDSPPCYMCVCGFLFIFFFFAAFLNTIVILHHFYHVYTGVFKCVGISKGLVDMQACIHACIYKFSAIVFDRQEQPKWHFVILAFVHDLGAQGLCSQVLES
jgi:hypothetical protein